MIERSRERQVEDYDRFMVYYKGHLDRIRKGRKIQRGDQLDWNHHKHAISKYYLSFWMDDVPLSDWIVFVQALKTQNGKHRHQGGLALFILEGRGYTVTNGVRNDWEEGDLVLLPILPEQCEHQHFNLDPDKPSKFIAIIYLPFNRYMGGEFAQVENRPGYEEALRSGGIGNKREVE